MMSKPYVPYGLTTQAKNSKYELLSPDKQEKHSTTTVTQVKASYDTFQLIQNRLHRMKLAETVPAGEDTMRCEKVALPNRTDGEIDKLPPPKPPTTGRSPICFLSHAGSHLSEGKTTRPITRQLRHI